ncbi:MAG TPA: methionine--tRNA ligase subunit beta, partial [Bacteroidetes bacterium]|nr:methionine--tRNA ligase subunit beta [Bacteroidota bacterium]
DQELIARMKTAGQEVGEALDRFQFKEATRRFMDLARFANKYFNDSEPWKTRKTDPERCGTTLNLCVQATYNLAVLMEPFLPFTAAKVWKMLNLPGTVQEAQWDRIGELPIADQHPLGTVEILFRKIEDAAIEAEIARLKQALEGEPQPEPEDATETDDSAMITIDDFQKVQLKSGRVVAAEPVPKSDRLLKLQVDMGRETRQLVAGIAQYYQPEELIGKTVIVVANLKPAKIRGVESQGMLLAVKDGDKLSLLTTDRPVSPGKPVS